MSTQSQWIKISNYKQANINSQRKTEGQPSPWIDCLKIVSTCHTCPMTQREALMVTWELDKTARCSQGPIDLCYILDVYKLVQCWTLYKLYLWIVSIYTSLQYSYQNLITKKDECFLIYHINSTEKKQKKPRRLVYLCTCICTHRIFGSSEAVNWRILIGYSKQLLSSDVNTELRFWN